LTLEAAVAQKTSETAMQKIFASCPCREIWQKSGQPPAPITGPPLHVHHGDNPGVFRFFHENYRVRKIAAEMPAHRRVKFAEAPSSGEIAE
jgi:hypothetical protein